MTYVEQELLKALHNQIASSESAAKSMDMETKALKAVFGELASMNTLLTQMSKSLPRLFDDRIAATKAETAELERKLAEEAARENLQCIHRAPLSGRCKIRSNVLLSSCEGRRGRRECPILSPGLQDQRDALLAACKRCIKVMGPDAKAYYDMGSMEDAIAKTENAQ